MGAVFSVDGFSDLLDEVERMAAAPAHVENEALKAAAQPICDEAKKTTAFIDRSGKLRESIKVGKVKKDSNGAKYVLIATDDPIAHLVEEGHGGPSPAPAHPYMRPAFEAKKGEAVEIIKATLKEALK